MVASILYFRVTLIGTKFTVHTDHKPLLQWLSKPPKTERHARWLVRLQDFEFEVKHIAGDDNVMADLMSRPNIEKCSRDKLYEDMHIDALQMLDYTEELKEAQTKEFVDSCKRDPDELEVIDGLVFTNDNGNPRLLVPPDFRKKLLEMAHGFTHFGIKRTLAVVKQNYVWPSMAKDIEEYVQACPQCQKFKIKKVPKRQWLRYNKTQRFKTVHIDLVGPLPKTSSGKRFIFTMIDRNSSWFEAIPLATTYAIQIASLFYKHWICRFGIPEVVVSDQGVQFESYIFKDMLRRVGIEKRRTAPYTPQTNGKVERAHGTMKNIIRCLSYKTKDWEDSLYTALLGMRTAINDTGVSPSLLVYGEQIAIPGLVFDKQEPVPGSTEEVTKFLVQYLVDLRRSIDKEYEPTPPLADAWPASMRYAWYLNPVRKGTLDGYYLGPYEVLQSDRYPSMLLAFPLGPKWINVNKLKPAYGLNPPGMENVPIESLLPDIIYPNDELPILPVMQDDHDILVVPSHSEDDLVTHDQTLDDHQIDYNTVTIPLATEPEATPYSDRKLRFDNNPVIIVEKCPDYDTRDLVSDDNTVTHTTDAPLILPDEPRRSLRLRDKHVQA